MLIVKKALGAFGRGESTEILLNIEQGTENFESRTMYLKLQNS